MEIIETNKIKMPERCLIFGDIGNGKSTLASTAPSPIFINVEDRLSEINAKAFPIPKSYADFREQLVWLYKENHEFETVVVDTADALEMLIFKQVCLDNNVKNISDVGFGGGYTQSLNYFAKTIDALNALRKEKNMRIIVLAHSQVKLYNNPLGADFDRIKIKLRDKHADLFLERMDIVGYLHTPIYTSEQTKAFGNKKTKASGTQDRVFSCYKSVAFETKDSYGIDYDIEIPKENGYQNILNAIEETRK